MASADVQIQTKRSSNFFSADTSARTLVLSLVLLLFTLALYAPLHGAAFFSLDDYFYVVNNVHIQQGLNWETVRWAFTNFHMANWIPLSFLSHAVDYQLFGLDPAGYHDVNSLLHALNAVLLFWVLKRATGYTGRSFMVAALFAVHPLNVEGVAWVAERKTVLSMFFFLLALGAYGRYARKPKEARYWLVVLLYALGLLAKSQIITLPCVLLLWDYWPLQRMSLPWKKLQQPPPLGLPQKSLRSLLLEKTPFLLLAAYDAMLTVYSEGVARPRYWPPFSERLGNAIFSYARYIKNAFWPTAMAPMYPNPGSSLTKLEIGGSALVLLAVTALVLASWRQRYLVVGWLWFLGTLVPTVQIIQFGKEGMADRFAYQALIGLFIMVCWGLADWAANRRLAAALPATAGAVAVLALAMVSHRQIGYWKQPSLMWRHALEVVPNHWEAYDQLGLELAQHGKVDEAYQYFLKAASVSTDDSISNLQIAVYDQMHGNPVDALKRYEIALRDPALSSDQVPGVYRNMSIIYQGLGDEANAHKYAAESARSRQK